MFFVLGKLNLFKLGRRGGGGVFSPHPLLKYESGYEDFYRSLKAIIAKDKYEKCLKMFKANDCTTIGDWLRVYNVADVVPFIEVFRKMAEQ